MKRHGKNSISSYVNQFLINPIYEERWIFIGGEKSIYKIRSNGEIISTEYQGHKRKSDYVMSGGVDNDGYRLVALTHNHKKKTYKIHRLVAEYFVPNPFRKPEVNHKDGNTFNNDYSNLEWVLSYENTHHAMSHGLRQSTNSLEYIHLVCQLLESDNYCISEISEISGISKELITKILNHVCYVSISDIYNIDNYSREKHNINSEFIRLSDEIINEICIEICKNRLTMSDIARKFNISITTVKRIINHETHKEITSNYSFNNYTMRGVNQFITRKDDSK